MKKFTAKNAIAMLSKSYIKQGYISSGKAAGRAYHVVSFEKTGGGAREKYFISLDTYQTLLKTGKFKKY